MTTILESIIEKSLAQKDSEEKELKELRELERWFISVIREKKFYDWVNLREHYRIKLENSNVIYEKYNSDEDEECWEYIKDNKGKLYFLRELKKDATQ